jgi:hypothetical protein
MLTPSGTKQTFTTDALVGNFITPDFKCTHTSSLSSTMPSADNLDGIIIFKGNPSKMIPSVNEPNPSLCFVPLVTAMVSTFPVVLPENDSQN